MTEIPPTIYIPAAGAIIAAVISGYWSFVNLIVSKDQKVSEFRQNWIDLLRNDMASYSSKLLKFQTTWMAYKHINKNSEDHGAQFLLDEKQEIQEIIEIRNRIRLRLNPVDNEDLITLIDDHDRYITSPSELRDGDKLIASANKFLGLSQLLLKSEWERVKLGERGFRYTRNISITVVLVFVLIAIVWGVRNA